MLQFLCISLNRWDIYHCCYWSILKRILSLDFDKSFFILINSFTLNFETCLLTILNEVQRHVTKTLCDIWDLTW